jgi:deazaflavin-dependent oxidoreductase (nitroreductase family)
VDKRRVATAFAKYLVNPVASAAVAAGLSRSVAILETTGRKTGEPRRTPVTNGLQGDVFWIVSEHGRRSAYVRNLMANPRVKVKVRGRWRDGTAHVLPDDDPLERQRRLPAGRKLNSAVVRALGTDLLTIRIDLEPA